METRSNHILVGGVVLVLVAITLAFVLWISQVSSGDKEKYDIFFRTSVDGLAKGSAVTFSGVPVGKVDDIKLMPESPEFVRVRIVIDDQTPVLQGTTASIAGVGFTGVSQINLEGAIRGAPPITDVGPYGVPVIPTKQGGLGALLASAPQLLDKLTTLADRLGLLLDDKNENSVAHILANMDKFSGSLAENGPQIKQTLATAQIAIKNAGDAADQIAKLAGTTNQLLDENGKPLVADLRDAVASAKHSMANLDGAISDARPGLKTFSNQTIPNADQLVRDLSNMAQALTAVADKINNGGAGGVLGGTRLPDYQPGK
jgi:phospholipid/cholesterol/gamma-HCH transport system substrate-binding protein